MTQKPQTSIKRYGFENQEEVLDTVQNPSNKIEFVRIMFADILGRPMDFSIPSSELKGAFLYGKGFDGSSVEGFVRIEESDLIIKPDPKTFRVLPWEYEIRKEIQILLKKIGIESEHDHHEVAHGQHEIDLNSLDALEMADTCMLFRYMAKKVARMHNLYATFMPKPLNGQNGSGMHVHQSLWKGGKNLFFEKSDRYHLSTLARHYIAGIMTHAREISAVLNQWTNSYKRLIEGYEAPVYIA